MKYTPEMNIELRRAVQNFNKKIKRLEAKGVSPSLLPSKASVRSLKLAYANKRDLNRRLNELKSFTAKGDVRSNTKNVYGTDALFKFRQKIDINKARTRKIKRAQKLRMMPMKYKSVKDDALLNTEAKIKFLDVDIENVDVKTLQRLNANALTKEEIAKKQETYYDNYFKMLFQEAQVANIDPYKRRFIEKELRKLTPEQLAELTETDATVKSIVEQYFGTKQMGERGEEMLSEDAVTSLGNKINALYEALPSIKGKYNVK